jgi:hypothetical protein
LLWPTARSVVDPQCKHNTSRTESDEVHSYLATSCWLTTMR